MEAAIFEYVDVVFGLVQFLTSLTNNGVVVPGTNLTPGEQFAVRMFGFKKYGVSSVWTVTPPQVPQLLVALYVTRYDVIGDTVVPEKVRIVGGQQEIDLVGVIVFVCVGVTDGVCVLLGVGVKLAVAVGVEAELYPTPSISQSTQFGNGVIVGVGVLVGVGVDVGVAVGVGVLVGVAVGVGVLVGVAVGVGV